MMLPTEPDLQQTFGRDRAKPVPTKQREIILVVAGPSQHSMLKVISVNSYYFLFRLRRMI